MASRVSNWTSSPAYRSDEVIAVPESPLYRAYRTLHWGLMAVALLAGLDKFANLTTTWTDYVAPQVGSFVVNHTPLTVSQFMMGVGGVEILAALLVAVRPRIGGAFVGLWLMGIVANLLLGMHYFDVALRDFGLMVAAFALSRLGAHFDRAHRLREKAADEVEEVEPPASRLIRRADDTMAGTGGRFWRHRDDDLV